MSAASTNQQFESALGRTLVAMLTMLSLPPRPSGQLKPHRHQNHQPPQHSHRLEPIPNAPRYRVHTPP